MRIKTKIGLSSPYGLHSNRVIWLLVLVVIMGMLLSCAKQEEKQLTVYLAVLPAEQEPYLGLIKQFETEQGVKVRLVAQQYGDIRRTVESEIAAGKGVVDVFEVDVYFLRSLVNTAFDLAEYLLDWSDKAAINPAAWEAGIIEGKVYYMPHRLNWQALIYNTKFIAKPPGNWDELLAVAKQYPGKIGIKGALYEGLSTDVLPYVWAAGGEPLKMNDEGSLTAMRFLQQLAPYLNESSKVYKENTIFEAQAKEEVYLHGNWPFAVRLLQDKGLLPEPNRTAMLPKGPEGYATVLGGGYLAISRVSVNKELAAKLLRFLASKEAQQFMVKELGWFPIRKDAWEVFTEEQSKLYKGFIDMEPFVKARPIVRQYEEISKLWQRATREIMFEGKPVAETLNRYAREAESLMGAGAPGLE